MDGYLKHVAHMLYNPQHTCNQARHTSHCLIHLYISNQTDVNSSPCYQKSVWAMLKMYILEYDCEVILVICRIPFFSQESAYANRNVPQILDHDVTLSKSLVKVTIVELCNSTFIHTPILSGLAERTCPVICVVKDSGTLASYIRGPMVAINILASLRGHC